MKTFLDRYPGLADGRFVTTEGNPAGLTGDGAGTVSVELDLPTGVALEDRMAQSRYQHWAYPSLHGTGRAQHPLMVWWALTYALSMLARYHARVWAGEVSISTSGDAVAIEHLLSQALVSLPELVHRTIMQAAGARG